MSSRKKVVIVGGGFGGLAAAHELADVDVDVVLVDRENHHLFQPLLYQVATAGLSPGQIAVPIRSVVRDHPRQRVVLDEAVAVDHDARELVLRSGARESFDYLLAATGARTNYFGNDAWEPHAGGIKSLRDALRFREKLLLAFEQAEVESDPDVRRALLTFVVIGGGPTGVEMAGSIAELGRRVLASDFRTIHPDDVRVVLVELADRLLLPFDPSLSADAKRQLEELGVEVRLGQKVTAIDATGVTLESGHLASRVVCWATGVRPNPFAEALAVPLERGRVKVTADCSAEGRPNVFVAGDMAYCLDAKTGKPLPGVAQVAIQMGRHAARCIASDLAGSPRPTFQYWDKGSMATIGRRRAILESGTVKLSGLLAWLGWVFVHVLYLIGFHNRMTVMLTWVWSYFTWKRGARLITSEIGERPTLGDDGAR